MKANVYDKGQVSDVPQRNQSGKPLSPKIKKPAKAGSTAWLVAAGLILLSVIPLAGGAFRLTQLAGGADITPANARFFASPLPVVLHIISVTLYAILGAFQFAPSLRRQRRGWHRAAGRILIPSGLVVALTGLWMTLFYSWAPNDGELVYGLRLFFGSAMLAALLLGTAALPRRDFAQHGAWMMRAYAIGMGAGTQALVLLAGELIAGPPSVFSRGLLMGAAWVINLAVAEWVIRKQPVAPARTASTVVSPLQ